MTEILDHDKKQKITINLEMYSNEKDPTIYCHPTKESHQISNFFLKVQSDTEYLPSVIYLNGPNDRIPLQIINNNRIDMERFQIVAKNLKNTGTKKISLCNFDPENIQMADSSKYIIKLSTFRRESKKRKQKEELLEEEEDLDENIIPEDVLFFFNGTQYIEKNLQCISFQTLLGIEESSLKNDLQMNLSQRLLVLSRLRDYKRFLHFNFQQKSQYDIYFESLKSQNKDLSIFFEKIFTLSEPSVTLNIKENKDLEVLKKFAIYLNQNLSYSIGTLFFEFQGEITTPIVKESLLFLKFIRCDNLKLKMDNKELQNFAFLALSQNQKTRNQSFKSFEFDSELNTEKLTPVLEFLQSQSYSTIIIKDISVDTTDDQILNLMDSCKNCYSLDFSGQRLKKFENWKLCLEKFFAQDSKNFIFSFPKCREKYNYIDIFKLIDYHFQKKPCFEIHIFKRYNHSEEEEKIIGYLKDIKIEDDNELKISKIQKK